MTPFRRDAQIIWHEQGNSGFAKFALILGILVRWPISAKHKRQLKNTNAKATTSTPIQKHKRQFKNTHPKVTTQTPIQKHTHKSHNTNANSKTQTPIQKHKPQFKNTDANSKTQTPIQKHIAINITLWLLCSNVCLNCITNKADF